MDPNLQPFHSYNPECIVQLAYFVHNKLSENFILNGTPYFVQLTLSEITKSGKDFQSVRIEKFLEFFLLTAHVLRTLTESFKSEF